MNEDALIYSYELFKNDGYSGSIDQYKELIRSDKKALDYSYNLFKNDGYSGSLDDFSGLIRPDVELPVAQELKKKPTVSPFVDGGSEPTEFDQEESIVIPDEAKPVEEPEKKGGKSYLSNLATSLGLGLASANEAIASIPESVINILAIPQNYIAEKTGLPISVTAEGIKKSWGITNPLLDYVQEEKKILSGEVSRFMAERYEDPSIVGNFQKGNYQDGFELLGSAITQSVPISLGLMAGGAYVAPLKLATVATLGFTEAQREELGEMDPTMSEAEKTLKAAGMAAAESVFSSISTGTIGKVYRDIAKREGAEAAKGILKDGLVKTYKKALEKTGVVAGFVGEGIEEAATQITQNVIAGRPAFEGAADAFVTGAGSGVVFTAPISAINAKRYIGDKVESINTKSKIGQILGDKANDIDMLYNVPVASEITVQQLEVANLPKSREILVSRLEKAVSDNRITEDDAKQSLFVFDKTQQVSNSVKDLDVSAEDKAKIATLLRQRDELKTKIQNKDDVLVVQEKQKIEQINSQIQEILSGPKQETPTYKVDGKDVTADVIDELINTKSKEELLAMNIEIKNDPEGRVEKFQAIISPQVEAAPVVPLTETEVAQAEPQGVTQEGQEKVRPAISEMAGESVTVRIGNRNVSGIVEVDEGGKATITEGSVTYEIPSDSQFSEFSRPVNVTKDGDFVVNGDSFNEARIVLEDGKKKALLVRQDGTTKAVTNPRVVEEIEYNIALASLEEMNDADADNLINQYEQQRKTEKPAESAADKTASESDEDRKLREAFEEIDLIEEMALMELEDVESQAKLVEHTPKTMKEAKTYLVKKNPDGSYQATLNGRKVARKEVLDDLGKLFEQRASEDISKLQEQTNKLKQEVEEKLFGKEKPKAEPQVTAEAGVQEEVSSGVFDLKEIGKNIKPADLVRFQELSESLREGELLLKDNVDPSGNKLTAEKRLQIEKSVESTKQKIQSLSSQVDPQTQNVETLRAQEQAELNEALTNAEQYMVDGKIDGDKITDPAEKKIFDDIYDKYDKLITPLIEQQATPEVAVQEDVVPDSERIATVPIEQVSQDPARFQYKSDVDPETGVSEKLKSRKFQRSLAGVISVWVDPNDGKTYVINGHHRLDLAKSTGQKKIDVRYIQANNAEQARVIGAMQNIAEGQGTDVDAAKIFRSGNLTVDQLKETGLSMTDSKVRKGFALSNLSDGLFNLVVSGDLDVNKAVIIGENIPSKDVQEQFFKMIKGKNLTNSTIQVMAQDIQAAPKKKEVVADLFGTTTTEIADYEKRASLVAGIRDVISRAKNLLGKAAKGKDFLEEYGNQIDQARSEGVSREAAEAIAVFDVLRNTSPEISTIIKESFEKLQKGETKSTVINEAAKRIIAITPQVLGRRDAKNDKARSETSTTEQTKEATEVVGKLDELLKLDPKEKGTGQKALDYLDGLIKDYDKIEKGGLGVNIALPVIKKIVQGIRALVNTGMNLNDAIKRVAKENGFTVKDVIKNINSVDETISKRRKVIVDEMAALKDQIRLEARAAREAKGDLNKKRKALAKRIISERRKGVINAAQARSIVNRISGVNLDNPIMVDRLIEYIEKVFDNANYAAEMTDLRKLQRQANSRNHTSMTNLVNQFTSINPERIPLNRLQDYIEALDFLNNKTPFYGNMNDIFDEISSYKIVEEFDAVKTMEALEKKYESIELNEVKSVEEYVALIKDINSFKRKAFQLLQEDVITQEDYEQLIDRVGKDQATVEKKYEKEISQIKSELISEIKNQRPKESNRFSKEENDLIRKYLELSDSDLKSLSPEDLFILNDLLENISNGEIDYYRFNDIISRAITNDGVNQLTKQVDESKFDMSSEKGRQELSEQESSFWEGLLGMGRAKSGALQKFIVSPFNRAIGSFESFIRNGYNNFLNLKDKYKIKNEQMNKIGMLTTYLQEYMAQFDPNNKGVQDIGSRDWFKEILNSKSMRDNYSSGKPSILKMIGRGPSEIDIIQKIWDGLPKDKDGNVDPKAVFDSYIANDGKFFTKNEKAFFDNVMTYKTSDITPKQKAANEISGKSFKEIPFHMLRVRLNAGRNQIQPSVTGENGMVRIKAGTGKERTSEKVGAVMTNFEKLFISSIEQTGRDYFLSGAIKDINNTLSGVRKNVGEDKTPLLNTISYGLSDALAYEFDRTQSNYIFRNLLSARAAITLLNPIRTAFELGATLISYPIRAKTLSGYKSLFGDQGDMKKLLEFTDSPMLLRDNISKAIDINDGSIEPQNRFTKATNYLSGLPERTMMVTSWMPTFRSEFKNLTGVDFDINKFNNSAAYREKYGKSIRESSAVADAQTEKIIGPTTKAGQRREVRIAPRFLANLVGAEGTVSKNTAAGQILGFFSNYPFREVTEFVNGFREAGEVLKDEGALSSLSQLQKPLGVALNVAAYGFLSSAAYALNLMLLGDDDDEKRGEELLNDLITTEGFLNELASNAISLVGSKYAAGGKALLQLAATIAIESTDDDEQKSKIKKLLKDSVFVNPLPIEQASKFGGRDKILASLSMYIPQFVIIADRFADAVGSLKELGVIYDKVEKNGIKSLTDDEGTQVLALNTLFNATQILLNFTGRSLPAYNNLKTYMNGLKEEAGVADVSKGKKRPGKTDREKSLEVVEKNKKLKDLRELKEKTRNEDELKAIRNKIIEMTGSDEAKEVIDAQRKALTERKKKLLYDSSKKQRFNTESDMKRLNPSLWRKRFGPNSDWSKDTKAKKVVENKLSKIRTKRVDREFREKSRN